MAWHRKRYKGARAATTMCSVASLANRLIDRTLWPAADRSNGFVPTYDIGGTECLLLTRNDATTWVVYCHGNAVTLADLQESGIPQIMVESCRCNFVAPAYPAKDQYGDDYDNKVIEYVRNAYEQVRADTTANVYVVGRSVGVGIALRMCERQPPAGLMLISGFTSVKSLAPWLVRWALPSRLDNITALKSFKGVRKLIIHGESDDLIPVDHAKGIFNNTDSASISLVPNMTHVPTIQNIQMMCHTMNEFMNRKSTDSCQHHYLLWTR